MFRGDIVPTSLFVGFVPLLPSPIQRYITDLVDTKTIKQPLRVIICHSEVIVIDVDSGVDWRDHTESPKLPLLFG